VRKGSSYIGKDCPLPNHWRAFNFSFFTSGDLGMQENGVSDSIDFGVGIEGWFLPLGSSPAGILGQGLSLIVCLGALAGKVIKDMGY
jgi:hypothetical protein